MNLRLFPILAFAVLAVACGKGAPKSAAEPAPAPPGPFATSEPPKDAAVGAAYPGRWAPRAADCQARPWVFAQRSLEDSAGLACTFITVEPTSAGYTINADCRRGGALAGGHLMLTLTGSGEMTVSDGPWPTAVSLVRCPPA